MTSPTPSDLPVPPRLGEGTSLGLLRYPADAQRVAHPRNAGPVPEGRAVRLEGAVASTRRTRSTWSNSALLRVRVDRHVPRSPEVGARSLARFDPAAVDMSQVVVAGLADEAAYCLVAERVVVVDVRSRASIAAVLAVTLGSRHQAVVLGAGQGVADVIAGLVGHSPACSRACFAIRRMCSRLYPVMRTNSACVTPSARSSTTAWWSAARASSSRRLARCRLARAATVRGIRLVTNPVCQERLAKST